MPDIPFGTPPTFPTGGNTSSGGWGSIFNPQNLLALGTSILGSVLNRPKGLSKEQQRTLDAQNRALQQLIATLSGRINQPLSVDPRERALLFNQIAETQQGAVNRAGNVLSRRGLSQSGIAGDTYADIAREGQRGQNTADLALWGAARQSRAQEEAQLGQLLGIPMQPASQGQSVGGAVLSGLSPMLAYLISLNQTLNRRGVNP